MLSKSKVVPNLKFKQFLDKFYQLLSESDLDVGCVNVSDADSAVSGIVNELRQSIMEKDKQIQ